MSKKAGLMHLLQPRTYHIFVQGSVVYDFPFLVFLKTCIYIIKVSYTAGAFLSFCCNVLYFLMKFVIVSGDKYESYNF